MKIKFKKLSDTAQLPAAIREGDIGFDLYSDEDFVLAHGQTKKIRTNIQLADMPTTDGAGNKIFMKVEGRSGLSIDGIFPIGGIVDCSYRGELGVVLTRNHAAAPAREFKKGDRIAQLVIYKVATAGEVIMEETDQITETNRGNNGFGSSGA